MSSQKRPNQHELFKATNIYLDAMRPFIVRNMKRVPSMVAEDRIEDPDDVEIGDFPHLVRKYWRYAFAQHFDPQWDARSRIGLIKEARNRVSHPRTKDISLDYALARLEDIADVLGAINAPDRASEVRAIRNKLASVSHDTPLVQESKPAAQEPKVKPSRRKTSNLTPWREVISPNSDVIDGAFRKSEFAADLQEVYDGKAKTEAYGETDIFFNQTYITPGLRELLVNTLRRLGGKGGAPVIQMKTGFGGGKTHSLIALYHLVTGAKILMDLPPDGGYEQLRSEIRDIMQEAEWDPASVLNAKVSVLDGTYLSTTEADKTKSGDPLNTLWGRMADQLGGQDAYDLISGAARQGISPGGKQLDELFEHVGPSVVLIDELVAYVRNVQGVTRDSIYTFIQALTQSVRRCEHIALVVTLPESQNQAGDEAGNEALQKLEEIFERIEDVWEPLEIHEAFEVVRRRLFGGDIDEAERDRTCEAYSKMYRNARREYPDDVSDQRYLQRMKECYPIHPEIFDRLYHDWSAIPTFQRTRGVLRIMANCVSRLYQKQDPSPLVMPANLTLDDSALADEFAKLLGRQGGQWNPVLTEVDSDGSLTDQIDMGSAAFLDVGSAARRVARTVFLGSATGRAVKGITTRQIHLGVVEPGQGVSIYNDALSRMTGNLYFLYNLDDRYYFHTQENLNKVAMDRAKQYAEEDIHAEIVSRLERAIGRDPSVKICPTSSGLVKDSETIQYVVLHPQASLPSREKEIDAARENALKILTYSADDERQRTFRNTLLFIAARRDDIRDLKNLVKNYLAWNSIMNEDDLHSSLGNLTGTRLDQTKENLESIEDAVTTSLFKAYRWALSPSQSDPQKNDYDFSVVDTRPEDGRIIQRLREKFADDDAIVTKIAPEIFAAKLQRYVWSSDVYQDQIEINRLWKLMAQNVYMPRLSDRNVLAMCIREGITAGTFGYANAYQGGDYRNFRFEEQIGGLRIVEDSTAVLINPEMAKLLKEAQREKSDPPTPSKLDPKTTGGSRGVVIEPPKSKGPTRVVVTKALQLELPFVEDIDIIQDGIARTLQADGGTVKIEITVTADKSDGFSENTARAVKQNSEHLSAEFKSD